MADYNELLTSIASVIKTNNRREITGQILQNVLSQMVGSLGENYQLAGFATPSYNPQEPDQNVFYVTDQAGQYSNFDNITLEDGLSFLLWKNEQWTSKTIGVATHQWVDNNYVSKAFFRQLFRPKDALGTEILANDTISIVDNIQSMVGLWTERYLTALGYGTDGGGAVTSLAQLTDVQLTTPIANNDVLTYNTTLGKWTNTSGGGTGTVRQIKVGTVTYDPVNGLVSLPAYPTVPTNISSFTNDVGYLTSSQLNYINWQGNATAMSGTSRFDWTGLRLYGVYSNGYPISYGNVIRVKGWGSGELLLGWNGDNTTAHIYYHSQRDVEGSSWGDWVTIIDSSNIGIQSVNYATSAGSATDSTKLPLAGGTMTGAITFSQNGTNINFTGGEHLDQWGNFWFAANSGDWNILSPGSEYRLTVKNSTGNVGIGTASPSYKLHVAGTIYATGGVTALSDERHKDIIDDTHLSVGQIAKMRSVLYRWDDGRADMSIYAGSIAQDWLCVLPQVVTRANNDEGTLSLQYGVAALIAAITIARKVVDHEKRISELESENDRLRYEVEQLKAT